MKLRFYYVGRAVDRQKRFDRVKGFINYLVEQEIDFSFKIFAELSDGIILDQRVQCFGFLENWWNQIERDEILILFSDYEGCPLVLLEAVKNGLSNFCVYNFPGAQTYLSSNCIINDYRSIQWNCVISQDFKTSLSILAYFDKKRFIKEVYNLESKIYECK
jgi:hypothetical protein